MMVVGSSDVKVASKQPDQQYDADTYTGNGKRAVQRAHTFIESPQQEKCEQDEDQRVCKE